MSVSDRTRAEIRYAAAQEAEKRAREGNDPRGIDEAKREQIEAMNVLARIDEATRTGAGEERVTLLSPNPWANVTDSNGVTFVDGKAQVKASLAERYLLDFEGYKLG